MIENLLSLAKPFVDVREPDYIYVRLIPSKSLRNYNSDKFITAVGSIYRSISKQFVRINDKICYVKPPKLSYYIYMEKNKANFFFIIPKDYYNMFKDKILDVWGKKITMEEVSTIPSFKSDCTKYYLNYNKDDALSLTCDSKNNLLLNSMFSIMQVLEEDDKIGVLYNFQPTDQTQWGHRFDRVMDKLMMDQPVNKNLLSAKSILSYIIFFITSSIDFAFNVSGLGTKDTKDKKSLSDLKLQPCTEKKKDSKICNTQILCFSESKDSFREVNNMVSFCGTFQCLDSDDNSIVYKRYKSDPKKEFDYTQSRYRGVPLMKVQPKEAQNFISLPAKELLEEYKGIDRIDLLETEVPDELRHGYITMGTNVCNGVKTTAYFRDNYDQGNFPLVILGEQGSGKTSYIANYVKCVLTRNESVCLIDYIKNCELSDTVEKVVPKDKLIILDMSNIEHIQGIGYNELKYHGLDIEQRFEISNQKSLYLQSLIESINPDGMPLTSSMDRYFSAASDIMFMFDDTSLRDVVSFLNDHEFRHMMISKLDVVERDALKDEINTLKDIDKLNSDGIVIGTKTDKIDGINHRINLLRKDYRLKKMFNKNCDNNIDFVNAIDNGKVILIKMPQSCFATQYSKNVLATYIFTKIWCATLIRGNRDDKPKRCHFIIDEIFQVKTLMRLLQNSEILPQTRKFALKTIISAQRIGQIPEIAETLESAGASYMLLKGSGKNNYKELKDLLTPYTFEDLESLPQYSSMNIVNFDKKRSVFITKLPPAIK